MKFQEGGKQRKETVLQVNSGEDEDKILVNSYISIMNRIAMRVSSESSAARVKDGAVNHSVIRLRNAVTMKINYRK